MYNMEKEQKLPRPTVELMNEHNQLMEQMGFDAIAIQGTEKDVIVARINELASLYNWDDYEFTDPITGKKGVKDAAGQILIPAEYEEFPQLGNRHSFCLPHMAAKKDGKFGIVEADGTGKVLADFRFDYLIFRPHTTMYQGYWDGVKDKFGFVNRNGKVIIPNILTKFYEPCNDFILLEADGKFGALDFCESNFVLPQYDKVDWELGTNVIFYKDGVAGYVIEETGEFIPKEKFDDEKYADVYVYNTYA